MLTFQQSYEKCQRISGDFSADTLTAFKQDINLGNLKFNAAIDNYFTRRSKSTDLEADNQYYQLPPDCIRVSGVDYLQSTGSRRLPVRHQIRSEFAWRQMNFNEQSSNWLTYWFVKGADELGLYPIPSTDVTDGLIIYYEPKGIKLSQDDYTTGTVTVTNGSRTVTHSGTGFTQEMIGRGFEVTDGSDGYSYKIAEFTSSSVIVLEEPYLGFSGSGKTFRIGETFMFPEEYHDAPTDFALARFFEANNNSERAKEYFNDDPRRPGKFNMAVADAREKYASSSSSQVITEDPGQANPWLYQITNVGE